MIKGKPDVTRFLDGAPAETSPARKPAGLKAAAAPKRQKLVELPEPLFEALKDRAYEDYKKSGRRVTETEIIVAALTQYLCVTH